MRFLGSFIDSKSMLHLIKMPPVLSVLLPWLHCASGKENNNTNVFFFFICESILLCKWFGGFIPWALVNLLYMNISKHSVLSPKVLKIPFGVVKVLLLSGDEHTNRQKPAPLYFSVIWITTTTMVLSRAHISAKTQECTLIHSNLIQNQISKPCISF